MEDDQAKVSHRRHLYLRKQRHRLRRADVGLSFSLRDSGLLCHCFGELWDKALAFSSSPSQANFPVEVWLVAKNFRLSASVECETTGAT